MISGAERKRIVVKNFTSLKNICDLFGIDWFKQQLKESKFNIKGGFVSHPLLVMLSYPMPDERQMVTIEKKVAQLVKTAPKQIVSMLRGVLPVDMNFREWGEWLRYRSLYEPVVKVHELNDNLGILRSNQKVGRLIKHAKNQFWSAMSEIEVIANFARNNVLEEIEPTIDGKTPDAAVRLLGNRFSVEIVTPEEAKILKAAAKTGRAVTIRNRLAGKRGILARKANQIPQTIPTILVINRSYSEIDFYFLENAMDGTLAIQLLFDTQTGQAVAEKSIRENDGLITIRNGEMISCAVMYKREIELGKRLVTPFSLKSFEKARRPLSSDEFKELHKIFENLKFKLN